MAQWLARTERRRGRRSRRSGAERTESELWGESEKRKERFKAGKDEKLDCGERQKVEE